MNELVPIKASPPNSLSELTAITLPQPKTLKMAVDIIPEQRIWLMNMFALDMPTATIIHDLDSIIEQQLSNGDSPWRPYSGRQLAALKGDWVAEWKVLSKQISSRIENVGVLAKNTRLMKLLQLAEEIHEKMWGELDKQGRFYLLSEYRAILRQIAEEKGELGEEVDNANDALLGLLELIGKASKPVGTQVQPADFDDEVIEGEVVG